MSEPDTTPGGGAPGTPTARSRSADSGPGATTPDLAPVAGPAALEGVGEPDPDEFDPPVPRVAHEIFGPRLPLARHYARLLATTGIDHGLVGPREGPQLWERHLLNSAVVAPGFGLHAEVLDIGSGAGLPGLVLAIARPDLRVTLVEPLQRRTRWLEHTLDELSLGNVTVVTGRAQALWGKVRVPHVTARAVARLATLAEWSLPLLQPGGSLLVMKGATAAEELAADRAVVERLGGRRVRLESYGLGQVDPPALVVRVEVDGVVQPPRRRVPSRRQAGGRRRRRG